MKRKSRPDQHENPNNKKTRRGKSRIETKDTKTFKSWCDAVPSPWAVLPRECNSALDEFFPLKLFWAYALAVHYSFVSNATSANGILERIRMDMSMDIRKGDTPIRTMCLDFHRMRRYSTFDDRKAITNVTSKAIPIRLFMIENYIPDNVLINTEWEKDRVHMLLSCGALKKQKDLEAWNVSLQFGAGSSKTRGFQEEYSLTSLVMTIAFKGFYMLHLAEWCHDELNKIVETWVTYTGLPKEMVQLCIYYLE